MSSSDPAAQATAAPTLLRTLLDKFGVRPAANGVRFPQSDALPAAAKGLAYVMNRADALKLIADGNVKVDGQVVRAFSHPIVVADGKQVAVEVDPSAVAALRGAVRLWAVNKPCGSASATSTGCASSV